MMSTETIGLTKRTQTYDKPPENKDERTSHEKTPSNGPLTIEKPILDTILCPTKPYNLEVNVQS